MVFWYFYMFLPKNTNYVVITFKDTISNKFLSSTIT